MNSAPSVIILGGGIAGLTCANILIEQGFDVTLFERNDIVGGLARSSEKTCPSEYSWRVFGNYYYNLLDLMKKIPDGDKTVFDNLVPVLGGALTGCDKTMPLGIDFNTIRWQDRLTLINILLQGFTSCDERNVEELSCKNWSEYLLARSIDEQTYNMSVKLLGPVLGFENDKCSIYDVNNAAEILFNTNYNPFYKSGDAYVTNKPTNLAFFDPWVSYLKEMGVQLYTSALVTDIITVDNLIESVNVTINGQKMNYKADYFVSAMSLESILELAKKNTELWDDRTVRNLEPLYHLGRQIQLSMQMYFDKRCFFHKKNAVAYLPNSRWAIIIEIEGEVWRDNFDMKKYCGSRIKDIFSIGICNTDAKGLLYNRSFVESSPDEIAAEVWYQIQQEPNFGENICIEDGTNFKDLYPIFYKIWDSFQFKNGKMDTWEPKWANNTCTKKLRPQTKTKVPNFFLSGAYCDTRVGIYSMSGACDSGISAANEIIASSGVGKKYPLVEVDRAMPLILALPRAIDTCAYKLGLPHLNKLFGGNSIVMMAVLIIIIILVIWYVIK